MKMTYAITHLAGKDACGYSVTFYDKYGPVRHTVLTGKLFDTEQEADEAARSAIERDPHYTLAEAA